MLWDVDNGPYWQAYMHVVESAPQQLPPSLLAAISRPEAVAAHDDYRRSPVRILVLGQETLNNTTPIHQAHAWHSWAHAIGEYVTFDFADGGDGQANGPFWTAFDRARQTLGLPTKRSLAWSNAAKCQLVANAGNGVSICTRPAAEREAFRVWQRSLLLAEMNFLRPDGVLAAIGPQDNCFFEALYEVYPCADPAWFDQHGYRVWRNLPFCMVSVGHPNGVQNVAVHPRIGSAHGLAALIRCLEVKGHKLPPLQPAAFSCWPDQITANSRQLFQQAIPAGGRYVKNIDGRLGLLLPRMPEDANYTVLERRSGELESFVTIDEMVRGGWIAD